MWTQDIDPLGDIALSASTALVLIVVFLVCLVGLRLSGILASVIALAAQLLVAFTVFRMPLSAASGSALLGLLTSLWPIAYIIVMAVWLYRSAVASGRFDVVRASIRSVSPDSRIQVLLISFAFGAFLEGGSPDFVVPIAILIPFLLVITLDGLRGLRETWPITLVVTLVFSLVQGSVLWFLGPELADLASGLLTMVAIFGLCRIWRPRRVYREGEDASVEVVSHSVREVIAAWSPFYILTGFILVCSLPRSRSSSPPECCPSPPSPCPSPDSSGRSPPQAVTSSPRHGRSPHSAPPGPRSCWPCGSPSSPLRS